MKYPKKWSGVDRGHEGQWAGPVWMQVFNILHNNAGASYQDPDSIIYAELSARIPEVAWKGKDETNPSKNRLFFRDAREPWSETDVIKFNEKTGLVEQTSLGLALAKSEIQADEIFRRLMANHDENGEKPFVILAHAFLEAGPTTSISLDELMNGVMHNYRPRADKLSDALNEGRRAATTFTTTETRRFKHMLSLLESVGGISANGSHYIAWNMQSLRSIAQSTRGTALQSSLPTLNHLLTAALAAKNFVILAGGTGTGKTNTAKLLATSIAGIMNVEVVAVGADWTDNRPLLGFRNLLAESGKTYVAPPALRIILKALENPGRPYFLILDEMNLSHVERYFADFLSSMESRENLKLHDSAQELFTEDRIPVRGKIEWPRNLFVIGTVNIDETTYMFSPKVLDRAHVIEFKVAWDEIEGGLEGAVPGELLPPRDEQVQEFMRVAQLKDKALSEEDHESLIEVLRDMHAALEGSHFVFAHRTARECLNFIASAQALAKADIVPPTDTKTLIDLAILQKALPKLNGAAGTLSKVLEELIKVSDKHDLTLCKEKLKSMNRQLKADQFVSFIQ